LDSELFGYEKGAFTGAVHARKGLFEEAHQGTLFLDEIDAMSAHLQAKLLGVLQDREVRKLGQNRMLSVDVRVVAATNADLDQAVARGELRQDLFYRLNVARMHLPSLRNRREDIPALVRHFLAELGRCSGMDLTASPEAMDLLYRYDYPGNARELQNALQWACAVATTPVIMPADLPVAIRQAGVWNQPALASESTGARTLVEHERDLILHAIARHQGNLTQTARSLGIGRTTLWRRIREYELKK
jgi:two-component system response regulator AtoC